MEQLKDDSGTIHKAVKKPFSGSVSLCGDNGMNITVDGRVRRIYGGAKRSFDNEKVNCKQCIAEIHEAKRG